MHMITAIRYSCLVLAMGLSTTGSMLTMAKAQATKASGTAPTSLTETYGNWVVRCVSAATAEGSAVAARVCEMTQELRQTGNNQRVLAVSVQPKDGGAIVTFVGPFGLLLSAGIRLVVDETELLVAGFHTCLPAGCVANTQFEKAALQTLSQSELATVSMTDTSGKALDIALSMDGFSAALSRVQEL